MSSINLNELTRWVSETYKLADPKCRHLRSHSNETYEVKSRADRYILKLYGIVLQHTDDEIMWEINLLDHLAVHGGPVAKAFHSVKSGGLCRHQDYRVVLFEYAPGNKPNPPFSTGLYHNEGIAMAAIHKAADNFTSEHFRTPLDTNCLIKEPSSRILNNLKNDEDKRFFKDFSEELTRKIGNFTKDGLDFGPIHGDATLDNLHVTEDGTVTWYDFDSGGPGWRAYDLQGWALLENTPDFLEKHEAFLKGYGSVRAISDNDLKASPYLHIASEIRGLDIDLRRKATESAGNIAPEFIMEQIAVIRNRKAQLQVLEQSLE